MSALATALTTIRRSPYQALVCVLMTAVTFFVAYSFSLFLLASSILLRHFETQPQVIAFFELETEEAAIQEVAQSLKNQPFVFSVKTILQDEALALYQEENKNDPLLLELVTADILPASVEVSGKSIESLNQIKEELEKFTEINEIVYQEDVVELLTSWITTLEQVGLGVTIFLSLISFLIIAVVIAMKAGAQKRTIGIMRILGATKWYIQAPFVSEGVVYGLIGSLLGWAMSMGALLYLTPFLENLLTGLQIFPIPIELYAAHLGIGLLLGALLGAFASAVASGRLIKK